MTYKPRLHHFARLLMSVAVGLSFTGCGNSSNSSDGGSTGPTLIDEGYACVGFEFGENGDSGFVIETVLQRNDTLGIRITTGRNDNKKSEDFIGSWSATQSANNTYQIKLTDIQAANKGTCTVTFNALTLTIPEDQLEAYRNGRSVIATLNVNFTHTAGGSCKLPEGFSAWKINDTRPCITGQMETLPPGMPGTP